MNRLLSVAIFCLAIAIGFFALQLAKLHESFSVAERALETVEAQLPTVLQASKAIRLQVHSSTEVFQQFNQQIPDILQQLDQSTSVLASYEKHLPLVIKQLEATNQNVAELTPSLPDIINSSNKMSATIADTNNRIKEITPLVPQVLEEVAQTRQALPQILDRAENLVANAKEIGQQTTQGAVSGIFTGLLKAPITLLGAMATPFTQVFDKQITESLSTEEYDHINQAIESAWQSKDQNRAVHWTSARGNKGSIRITDWRDGDCFTAAISVEVATNEKRKTDTKSLNMCRKGKEAFEADK